MELNFTNWIRYFRNNNDNLLPVGWDGTARLTAEEHMAIYESIRIFQKGESSEAKHLIKKVQDSVKGKCDKSYLDAMLLFINEEHRHAAILKKFMERESIPLIESHWTDTIFRKLRKAGGLEISITVLLTAEIIAAVYYKALRDSTQSLVLKQICRQILIDEDKHIEFQSAGLSRFSISRHPLINGGVSILKKILLAGTVFVVWEDHWRVMEAGKYNIRRFWRKCFAELRKSEAIIEKEIVNTLSIEAERRLFVFAKNKIVNVRELV